MESGAKTRTIRGFLGGEYDVVASGGHIVDLPDDELGVDIEQGFSFNVVPIPRGDTDAVDALKTRLADADEVYLATDPDREGEAIAADIRDFAVPSGSAVYRIEFNAIVYPVVREAIENPRSVDEERVEAQRARRSLDRLVGFILSSVAKFDPDGPNVPSVGRVQSPAVRLIVEREREIEAFDVREYWSIHAEIGEDSGSFSGELDGEWDEFEEAKTALAELLDRGAFTVAACTVDSESEQNPLPPYTTDSLQNDADFLLNIPPERTMELAQELYEGVTIGEDEDAESEALITYMRTDSTRVSPSALNLAKETLGEREDLGEELYLGRTWEAGGQAQDAHEAIRPTHPEDPAFWPDNLEGELNEQLVRVYSLIYNRFLASQMVPAVYRETTLSLEAGEYSAEAIGNELQEPGFLRVWGEVRPGHQRDEVQLPTPEQGSTLSVSRAWPEPEETQPPPRYREGSLVSELKNRGIGRPSTYGDVLSKIKRTGFGYVRKVGSTLRPTEKGDALVDYLAAEYPRVVDYEYTARMESDLDRIESGELAYSDFLTAEFEWLEEPYKTAEQNDWLSGDKPTVPQIEFLSDLAEETDTSVPSSVFESKEEVSTWIDKLQAEIEPTVRLTPIHEATVGGVDVYRFRVYFTHSLPDEEYEYLRGKKLKYKSGTPDNPPSFQFQRQDHDVVEERWEDLRARYEQGDVLSEYEFEVSSVS